EKCALAIVRQRSEGSTNCASALSPHASRTAAPACKKGFMSPARIRSRRMIPECPTIATTPTRFGFHMELRRLGLLILALACLSQARAAPFAYVPHERSGTVAVIDTASDQVVETVNTGGKQGGIAA